MIVYLNVSRTGLSAWPLDLLRVAVTLAVSTASYYLVERPIRLAHLRGWARFWGAPLAGVVTAVVIVVATIPAVADPSSVVGTTHLSRRPPRGSTVPGAGGYAGPAADPAARRTVVGRSAARHDPRATRSCTTPPTGSPRRSRRPARPRSHTRTIDGFGLTTATNWPHVHAHPHQPDPGPAHRGLVELGPVRADHPQRAAPAGAVHRAAAQCGCHDAGARERRRRGDLHRSSPSRATSRRPTRPTRRPTTRSAGTASWPGTPSPRRWRRTSRAGSCTSRWPAPFCSTGSTRPGSRPKAPRTRRAAQWIRVRKLDNVHLCPEGSARYADALLTRHDVGLRAGAGRRRLVPGAWTSDPDFNNPPGACPDDHPPAAERGARRQG